MKYIAALLSLVLLLGLIGCFPPEEKDKVETALLPEPDSPYVVFRVWVKVGSRNDPEGKEGLAVLTAQMLSDASTENLAYEKILDKLFPMATGYGASVDKEMTVFSGTVHKDNVEEFYSLFKDAILAPAFTEEDFNRVKAERVNFTESTRRFSTDEELGKELLFREIYRGTPYEHPEEGYVVSVKELTLDDVKDFYKTFYTRDNIVVGLGGGYSDELPGKVKADFAALPEGKPEAPAKAEPNPIDGLHVLIIEKDTAATAVSFGYPIGLQRSDPDFYAMLLANSWFGEHRNSSSHLYQVIRETRGMNYGDYSYIEAWPNGHRSTMPPTGVARGSQIFQAWIRPVRNHEALFAFRAALRELNRLVENGLTQEDFETTKNFLFNYTQNYGSTVSARLGYKLDDLFYGIPDPGYLKSIRPELDKLTLEAVNEAVKKHLQGGNMWVVFITRDAQALKDALVNNTPSPKAYSEETPQEVLDEDKIIEAYPLSVLPENVHIVNINEVLEK